MIKSKYITVTGAVLIVVAMVFTLLFSTGTINVFKPASANPKYADSLFDTSYVHKINIQADEVKWQEMLDNAMDEEYISCNITIDGETLNNVAIRPKGNTSLSTMILSDSDRYSFKVEFDHYDDGINYKGLDKLVLNNMIQDNSYLKDFLSYRIMQEAGAAAPLCSFAYITVNGQEWGLYLALEAVEEAFAKRVYGSNYGQLYKPDSMNMGNRDEGEERGVSPEFPEEKRTEFEKKMKNRNTEMPQNQRPMMPENFDREMMYGQQVPQWEFRPQDGFAGFGSLGGGAGALMYQDENADSYSVIFDSAVFNPDDADKQRVIDALKSLNEGDLENAVDTDSVAKYFAAHNFVVNFDSYTGNMLHNYYLYEEDGKLCMLPWDYNLAFGSFGGMGGRGESTEINSATRYVNFPIDTPVNGTTLEQRPMIGKLLENEKAKAQYHEALRRLVDNYFKSGDFEREFNRTFEMLAEYVQKDPTKFCTFDEFVKGAETLKEFCLLRAKSIDGQLDGTIPATTDGQNADTSLLVDASHISLGDTGSMGGGHRMDFEGEEQQGEARVKPVFGEDEKPFENGKGFGGGPMKGFDQHNQLPQDRTTDIIVLSICGALLLAGLIFVFVYKKKR